MFESLKILKSIDHLIKSKNKILIQKKSNLKLALTPFLSSNIPITNNKIRQQKNEKTDL